MQVVGELSTAKRGDPGPSLETGCVLMDLVMPKLDGIEATRRITAQIPGVRVLVLTSFATDDKVFPAIKAGALGYLLKDSGPDELIQAIRQVCRGEPTLAPSIARKVLAELAQPPKTPLTSEPLTEREMDILRLMAQGMSNGEIADQLTIAEMTVRTHVSHILASCTLPAARRLRCMRSRKGWHRLTTFRSTKNRLPLWHVWLASAIGRCTRPPLGQSLCRISNFSDCANQVRKIPLL